MTSNRSHNLDLIRLIAAFLVLFAHSWDLALGTSHIDPITLAIKPYLPFGYNIGLQSVFVFFAISGYLITRSLLHTKDLYAFTSARILRIYPALIVNVVLVTLVLGGSITTLGTWEYVLDGETREYLFGNGLLNNVEYDLPGVFQDNPYPGAVNGSLWTLPKELAAYRNTAILFVLGLLVRRHTVLALVIMLGVMHIWPNISIVSEMSLRLLFAYGVGSLFYLYRLPNLWMVGMSIIAAMMSFHIDQALYDLACITSLTTVLMWLGFCCPWSLKLPGDISYGVYIYAFPVQQVIAWYGVQTGEAVTPVVMLIVSSVMTTVLAILSWIYVEKPALSKKANFAGWCTKHGNRGILWAKQKLVRLWPRLKGA